MIFHCARNIKSDKDLHFAWCVIEQLFNNYANSISLMRLTHSTIFIADKFRATHLKPIWNKSKTNLQQHKRVHGYADSGSIVHVAARQLEKISLTYIRMTYSIWVMLWCCAHIHMIFMFWLLRWIPCPLIHTSIWLVPTKFEHLSQPEPLWLCLRCLDSQSGFVCLFICWLCVCMCILFVVFLSVHSVHLFDKVIWK